MSEDSSSVAAATMDAAESRSPRSTSMARSDAVTSTSHQVTRSRPARTGWASNTRSPTGPRAGSGTLPASGAPSAAGDAARRAQRSWWARASQSGAIRAVSPSSDRAAAFARSTAPEASATSIGYGVSSPSMPIAPRS
ncbi:hypothetical protein ACNF49_37020 [Actinomadura sp. ATCC 39365]